MLHNLSKRLSESLNWFIVVKAGVPSGPSGESLGLFRTIRTNSTIPFRMSKDICSLSIAVGRGSDSENPKPLSCIPKHWHTPRSTDKYLANAAVDVITQTVFVAWIKNIHCAVFNTDFGWLNKGT